MKQTGLLVWTDRGPEIHRWCSYVDTREIAVRGARCIDRCIIHEMVAKPRWIRYYVVASSLEGSRWISITDIEEISDADLGE